MTGAMWARIRVAVVLVVALVIETTFGADLRVIGVAPDLLLLVAIGGGLVCGPDAGAWIGFLAGLIADLALSTTPVGLSALVWCLVGWGVGTLRANVLPEGRAVRSAVAFMATVGGLILFLVVGGLVGQGQLVAPGRAFVIRVVLIEGLWNAVLVIPAVAVLGWASRGLGGVEALRRPDPVTAR
jgi:rod shape-determining protein MreD